MKIKKIGIQNFKVFQDTIIDFETSDLIVFDGPNGFGKTSIYDAVELLFTGNIRRFDALRQSLIDGRESYSEHPFLCDFAHGDISITIEFSKGDTNYILQRKAIREELTNSVNFSSYRLYLKNDFNSEENTFVENEDDYLNLILGYNYKQNFQFLNYIEQEDSLFLLKTQDKHRKQHISHLFNVIEFENKIRKIDRLKNKISELCNTQKKDEIDTLKESIQKIETFLSSSFENIDYIKLFYNREVTWDLDQFNYESFTYENLFNEEGIISRLKKLVENKEGFKKYIENEKIERLIKDKEKTENFLLYYYFFPNKESLQNQKNEVQKIIETVNILKKFSSEDVKDENFVVELMNFGFIEEDLIFNFEKGYSSLHKNFKELDKLETIYSKIEESRNKLISNIKNLRDEGEIELDGNCFLCGYEWSNINELLENIEIQSQNLEEIATSKSITFNEELEKFKEEVILSILELLTNKINDTKIDLIFIEQLLLMDQWSFINIKKDFDTLDFNYNECLNEIASSDSRIDFENTIIPKLSLLKSEVELANIELYFKELFTQYFDNKFELLESVQIENILQKENYLKYKYSLLQNETLISNRNELINKESKLINADQLENKLKNLNNIYKNSLKEYQKKVIRDIEIIFHIYSGRIMQDFQGGLGLFIYSDKDGIRFQTNPNKTFDAVFSMSSGQLAALIISFTLALHKKYSHNKIILIDDPVQTMDEINLVGFIELLRNEFYSHQLVISTHEDMASVFMRYKFKNYGLSQKRINLKAHQN